MKFKTLSKCVYEHLSVIQSNIYKINKVNKQEFDYKERFGSE